MNKWVSYETAFTVEENSIPPPLLSYCIVYLMGRMYSQETDFNDKIFYW